MNNNSYAKILKENNIDINQLILEDGFPVYKKSRRHGTIVKFTNRTSGYIVRESSLRTSDTSDTNGSLGKLGYSSNNWCEYDDPTWWEDLSYEELLQFDEKVIAEQKKIYTRKEQLKAFSYLLSGGILDGNDQFENEVLDALTDIAIWKK